MSHRVYGGSKKGSKEKPAPVASSALPVASTAAKKTRGGGGGGGGEKIGIGLGKIRQREKDNGDNGDNDNDYEDDVNNDDGHRYNDQGEDENEKDRNEIARRKDIINRALSLSSFPSFSSLNSASLNSASLNSASLNSATTFDMFPSTGHLMLPYGLSMPMSFGRGSQTISELLRPGGSHHVNFPLGGNIVERLTALGDAKSLMHGLPPRSDPSLDEFQFSSILPPSIGTTALHNLALPPLELEGDSVSSKERRKLKNKEHARNARARRKQQMDLMKATLIQFKAQNDQLVQQFENNGNTIFSILEPNQVSQQKEYLESLKTSESLVEDIIKTATDEAEKQIELNYRKVKSISFKKSKVSNSASDDGDDDSVPGAGGVGVGVGDGGGIGDGDENASEDNSNSANDDEGAKDINRKNRNRIHSMNSRERKKRFRNQLEDAIEVLRVKNIKLTEMITQLQLEQTKPT